MSGILEKILWATDSAVRSSYPITIAAATSAFWAVFGFLQYTKCVLPTATVLKPEIAQEWNIRAVSNVHAVILVTGSYLCFKDASHYTPSETIFGYSFYPDFFARIFLGYLIYDLSNLSIFFKTLRDYSGMLHHALFIYITTYVLAFSIFKFPFAWLSLGEASTPFVNIRWCLAVVDGKNSKWYLFNGLLLAISFFLARIVASGLGLYHLWTVRNIWLKEDVPYGHKMCVVMFVAGYCLNVYWFAQILQGLGRAFGRSQSSKTKLPSKET